MLCEDDEELRAEILLEKKKQELLRNIRNKNQQISEPKKVQEKCNPLMVKTSEEMKLHLKKIRIRNRGTRVKQNNQPNSTSMKTDNIYKNDGSFLEWFKNKNLQSSNSGVYNPPLPNEPSAPPLPKTVTPAPLPPTPCPDTKSYPIPPPLPCSIKSHPSAVATTQVSPATTFPNDGTFMLRYQASQAQTNASEKYKRHSKDEIGSEKKPVIPAKRLRNCLKMAYEQMNRTNSSSVKPTLCITDVFENSCHSDSSSESEVESSFSADKHLKKINRLLATTEDCSNSGDKTKVPDVKIREFIDQFAQHVAQSPEIEKIVINNEQDNEDFAFLYDPDSSDYRYYRQRVAHYEKY